jgi:hypothetical protein
MFLGNVNMIKNIFEDVYFTNNSFHITLNYLFLIFHTCINFIPVNDSNRSVCQDILMNARQLGPRQVNPYVKTTRTVLLFYNIVQYLYICV